jgi:hypothetical protein
MLPIESGSMAITIRNKTTEEDIREIGRETGEGPSKIIARLAADEKQRLATERKRTAEERLARMRAYRATLPKFTEEEKKAVWQALEDMYDEDGLPQ